MDLLPLVPDNIGEVLRQIIRFSERRRHLLHRNIEASDIVGYVPHDLPVDEFAEALNGALVEHLANRRLLFRDTANIQFGKNGQMQLQPIVDDEAMNLLDTDRGAYLELQIRKLLENALNRTIAQELTKQKGGDQRDKIDLLFSWVAPAGDAAQESRPDDAGR
jgi:hypothetical protein